MQFQSNTVKTKDFIIAKKAVEKLKQLYVQTIKNDEDYWALLVDAQRKTVEAWILYGHGKYNEALALMAEAADQKDSVGKHPLTPSVVLPDRELLGDMLLMREKPEKAVPAYKDALKYPLIVLVKRQNGQAKQIWRKLILLNL